MKSKVVRRAVLMFLEGPTMIEKRPLMKSKVVRRAIKIFLEGLLD